MVDNHGSGRQTENQLTNFLSMTENSLDLPEKVEHAREIALTGTQTR